MWHSRAGVHWTGKAEYLAFSSLIRSFQNPVTFFGWDFPFGAFSWSYWTLQQVSFIYLILLCLVNKHLKTIPVQQRHSLKPLRVCFSKPILQWALFNNIPVCFIFWMINISSLATFRPLVAISCRARWREESHVAKQDVSQSMRNIWQWCTGRNYSRQHSFQE